jgi:hypothetical protein
VITNKLRTYLAESQEAFRQPDGDAWMESTTKLCDDTRFFTKLVLVDADGSPIDIGVTYLRSTLALLKQVQLAPRPVCINCQHPQTGLAPYSENRNFLLSTHLLLAVEALGIIVTCFESNRSCDSIDDTTSLLPTVCGTKLLCLNCFTIEKVLVVMVYNPPLGQATVSTLARSPSDTRFPENWHHSL